MKDGLSYERGSECNPVKIGGETILLGDPAIKPEKPYTIVTFPGGSVEISRTTDGAYWVHLAVKGMEGYVPEATIIDARIDPAGRYADEANKVLRDQIGMGDVKHIAFLVQPGAKG